MPVLSSRSVVGLSLHPVARRKFPHDELPDLVVDQDEEGEGESRQPPEELDALHLQDCADARAVAEEGGQESLEDEGGGEVAVPHPLLEQGVAPRLADQDGDDGDEEGGLQVLLSPVIRAPLELCYEVVNNNCCSV